MFAASPAATLLAGIAVLSGMDALIKHLSATNHTLVVALGRYVFGTVFALGIWLHARAPAITWAMWKAHTLRGVVIALAGVSFFWSISVLPLAEAVAYAFFYPLIVPFVASAIIGERVRGASFAAAALGFIGVVIAAQGAPSIADDPLHAWGVAAVIFSSFAFAISVALMRARAQADGAAIVGVLASFIPGVLILAPTMIFAPPPRLTFTCIGARSSSDNASRNRRRSTWHSALSRCQRCNVRGLSEITAQA